MVDPIRIPLVEDIEPRLSDSSKDGLASNVFYDKDGETIYATKRPGMSSFVTGQGSALGIFGGFVFVLDLQWNDTIYANSKFVSVSQKIENFSSYPDLSIISSDNGITWEQGFLPTPASGNTFRWKGIAWNGTSYCTVGENYVIIDDAHTSGGCATSTTGLSWTSRTIVDGSWNDIASNGSDFVAVGIGPGFVSSSCYSTDNGVSWTTGNLTNTLVWESVAYNSTLGLYAAVSSSSTTTIATSPTGATWTNRTASSAQRYSVVSNGTIFFSPRYNSNKGDVSSDGITWTEVNLPSTRYWYKSYWTGTRFIILSVGGDLGIYIASSTDGTSWTETQVRTRIDGGISPLYSLAANGAVHVVLGWGNPYIISTDSGSNYLEDDLERYYPYSGLTY